MNCAAISLPLSPPLAATALLSVPVILAALEASWGGIAALCPVATSVSWLIRAVQEVIPFKVE